MAYAEKYRIRFTNRIQNNIWYAKFMFKDYTGDSTLLKGSETPITISYTGGDTDPLTPIQAMEINISFLNEGQLTFLTSGNADINFTSGVNLITIDDQVSDLGIRAGMVIRIDGVDYNITVVSYNDLFNQIIIQVSQSLIDQSLPAEDFEIYGPLGIEFFYSDDDQYVRVDVYHETTPSDKLIATGFLIQDGISEAITDFKHVIQLKATDNLALLKNISFSEVNSDNIEGQFSLYFFIAMTLEQAGLFSITSEVDLNLPIRIYDNLFENSEDDRADDDTNNPLAQNFIYSNMFKDNEGNWQDCYSVLEAVLFHKNAVLFQSEGYWNVIRKPEYQLFDGEIPGTEYDYNGPGTSAITLDSLVEVNRKGEADCYPIEEDQIKTIQRPIKLVSQTFNYNSINAIIQQDLSLPPGATPYDTSTTDGIREDKYDLATYFPYWKSRNGDASYLVVLTDTNVTPENEIDRYIAKPSDFDVKNGVQLNYLQVSQNDTFNFELQFNTHHTDGFFFVRYILITEIGDIYSLDLDTGTQTISWVGPIASTDWYSEPDGVRVEKQGEADQWFPYSLLNFVEDGQPVLIPEDGVLLIEIDGNSSTTDTGYGTYATKWKDIRLTLNQYINSSTQIVGHTHTNTGNQLIKSIQENERVIDDAPRRTIEGALFTSAVTDFDFTDTATGEETEIGDIHFNLTSAWHRGTEVEALRLGNIITEERLIMSYVNRLIVEGTFRNLTIASGYVSPLSLFTFHFAPGRFFISGSITLDLMNASFNGRFFEIYDNNNLLGSYTFKYIYDNGNS